MGRIDHTQCLHLGDIWQVCFHKQLSSNRASRNKLQRLKIVGHRHTDLAQQGGRATIFYSVYDVQKIVQHATYLTVKQQGGVRGHAVPAWLRAITDDSAANTDQVKRSLSAILHQSLDQPKLAVILTFVAHAVEHRPVWTMVRAACCEYLAHHHGEVWASTQAPPR